MGRVRWESEVAFVVYTPFRHYYFAIVLLLLN